MGGALRCIPAHAGNTKCPAFWPSTSRAHPRWRGEHLDTFGEEENFTGSSPLARGTREAEVGESFGSRLIPAHAGNTHHTE